ncbi:MAG: hypothetical protein L0387_42475 [Acidobacteria bacterium]|nr:hypothetical protein [Acidobacteriota bacterium]MCI0628251.1 hypothetical protein [Acidobacteriota bacterium]MCI0722303.1 hypothetical protein [Acidobacteriota bacterium]
MKVISVAAPCNGSGKTSFILSILKTFPNTFAFTKFTTIYRDEQFCPAKDHDCACRRLQGDYTICTDAEVLSQPDTDTGKIWRAGALQTLWCVAKPEGYPEMLREYAANYLRAGAPLLSEGSTVVRYLKPCLQVAVVNPLLPKSWWKDDAEEALHAATYVVVNRHPAGLQTSEAAPSDDIDAVLEHLGQKCVTGSMAPLDEWDDQRPYHAVAHLLQARS